MATPVKEFVVPVLLEWVSECGGGDVEVEEREEGENAYPPMERNLGYRTAALAASARKYSSS